MLREGAPVPVVVNIGRLLPCPLHGRQRDLHPVAGAVLAHCDGIITYAGRREGLPPSLDDGIEFDAGGGLVLPGFVECHTHLLFAGSRAGEFGQRLEGASYMDIARRGGGIQRTVRETRSAGDDALLEQAARTLRRMVASGVTTVECKSGYGLSLGQELRLLRLYRELEALQPARLVATFLGAHVPGPEYRGRKDAYVDLVVNEMLPAVAAERLAAFCDVFVEEGAFTAADARRILFRARDLGLAGKLHVDQLTDMGGGELAAELGVASADHLEHLSDRGIAALASSRVVAVALPLAGFFLKQPPLRARALIDAGIPVAVSTDYNPGTAPSYNMQLALLLACVVQGMTAAEALKGATIMAAKALRLDRETGSLEPGKRADFLVVRAPSEEAFVYEFACHPVADVVIGGRRAGP